VSTAFVYVAFLFVRHSAPIALFSRLNVLAGVFREAINGVCEFRVSFYKEQLKVTLFRYHIGFKSLLIFRALLSQQEKYIRSSGDDDSNRAVSLFIKFRLLLCVSCVDQI
jgi:hypothetical protein